MNRRRPHIRILLAALSLVLLGALGVVGMPAQADTADPGIAIEGWFARNKPRSPEVEVPCPPPPLPPPPTGCGPVNPGEVPAPQSPDQGAYVTASAGGDAGRSDTSGDIGWQAYQWDLLSYIGATVQSFVVTFTQAPDNQGDTPGPWPIQGCNIVGPFGAAPGSNPWPDRPTIDESTCVVPTVDDQKRTFTFDVTRFAETWIKGTGYGLAIVPGTPTQRSGLRPFQITFAGYASKADNADAVRPKVAFEFAPAAGLDFDSGGGFDDFGGGLDSFDDSGGFVADPSIDVFPTDVGSEPIDSGEIAAPEPAAPTPERARPVRSQDPGFPWFGWLLLPLGLALFYGTGTALGPAGDPVLPRRGGLSRLIERRRAATIPQGD